MKKDKVKIKSGFWKKFFIVLGIIFSILIFLIVAVGIYVAVAKPFGIDITKLPALIGSSDVTESSYDHPLLSEEQEIFLESIGIETEEIPTSITPEQEACAVEKLGEERVGEIKAGAPLKASDYLKAGDCL